MASSSHLEGNNNSMQPCIGLKRVPCQTIKELSTIQPGFSSNYNEYYFKNCILRITIMNLRK